MSSVLAQPASRPVDLPAAAPDAAADALWHLRAANLLADRGLLSSVDLGIAIADVLKWRSNLGEVLIGKGQVRPIDYYRALADVHGLAFVNLLADPPDADFLFSEDRDDYLRLHLLPWRFEDDRCVIAAVETGDAQHAWAKHRFGADGYRFVITSPFDIFWQVQDHFREADSAQARDPFTSGSRSTPPNSP
jgi:hypothetical protein